MTILLYLLVGLVIGVISGTLGIGGGVLLVPALIWVFGFDQPKAAGTSLAILVPPIGLLAAWEYFNKGLMDLQAAAWIAAAFAGGAYLGAVLVPYIPVSTLRLLFGLIMIYIAVRFLMAGNSEVACALVGLGSVAAAWLAYLGLRTLGRKHLQRPPGLGEAIRKAREEKRWDSDYHI